ncbi:MAG: hypothetical protein ABID87_02720 [Chloroflexota bacterium]
MKKKLLFLLAAVILLTPWPVAYAYDNTPGEQSPVDITAAAAGLPGWTAYGSAIGGVSTPGTLYFIDATTYPGDTQVTLYLTNTLDLSHDYRYLMLRVGLYAEDGADWTWATAPGGDPFPKTYLTMRNGRVSFSVPGYARYKLTVDGGSFYCYPGGTSAVPEFYLTAE